MRINKNDKINGIPIKNIRDFFRMYNHPNIMYRGFSIENLKNNFDLNRTEADRLIKHLIDKKYICKNTYKNDLIRGDYLLDDNGSILCSAKLISPISKEKADKIFYEFMQRVYEINNNDYYLVKVVRIYLFGSYLDKEKKDYGDIDIGYELKRKINNFDKYTLLRQQRIEEMQEKGKYFQTFDEELNFPEKEVKLKLKNKCRYISLQPINDNFFSKIKYKQIYPKVKLIQK